TGKQLYLLMRKILSECSQILQRNVAYEIPALKKQITKVQQTRDECHLRHVELEKNIHEIEKQYIQLCTEMSIKGESVEAELNERIEYLPILCNELVTEKLNLLKQVLNFYEEFVVYFHQRKDSDLLSILKYLVYNGNLTVYEWRTGHAPTTIERPIQNYKTINAKNENEDETNQIIGLDDDNNLTIESIEIEQEKSPIKIVEDSIDLDTDNGIDWSAIDTVPELLDPSVDRNIPTTQSITDAINEAVIIEQQNERDGGIARGNDALTLLENRSTYILFMNNLNRLQSFLRQCLSECNINGTILMTFIMQNAPFSIQNKTENDLKTYLLAIDSIYSQILTKQFERLFLMRDSSKYRERLLQKFQQKTTTIERNRYLQREYDEKTQRCNKDEIELKQKLNLLIHYTKHLKEQ
ncbi:unnamed protein product, partial [Didymodactylos carnosus]